MLDLPVTHVDHVVFFCVSVLGRVEANEKFDFLLC